MTLTIDEKLHNTPFILKLNYLSNLTSNLVHHDSWKIEDFEIMRSITGTYSADIFVFFRIYQLIILTLRMFFSMIKFLK